MYLYYLKHTESVVLPVKWKLSLSTIRQYTYKALIKENLVRKFEIRTSMIQNMCASTVRVMHLQHR